MGYSKTAKIQATDAVVDILMQIQKGKVINSEQYEQLAAQKGAIKDGTLGKLVKFHLEQAGVTSLEDLLRPKNPIVTQSDDEGLFTVPAIDGSKLADKTQASTVKVVITTVPESSLEQQRQIKSGIKGVKEEEIQPSVLQKGIAT